jgi:hypothetical protein
LRIEPDRFVVVCDGAVGVPLSAICASAFMEGKRVFRIEPDRLAKIRDGALGVALCLIRKGAVEEGNGRLRTEPYRFVIVRDGAVGVTLCLIRKGAVIESSEMKRLAGLEEGDGAEPAECGPFTPSSSVATSLFCVSISAPKLMIVFSTSATNSRSAPNLSSSLISGLCTCDRTMRRVGLRRTCDRELAT